MDNPRRLLTGLDNNGVDKLTNFHDHVSFEQFPREWRGTSPQLADLPGEWDSQQQLQRMTVVRSLARRVSFAPPRSSSTTSATSSSSCPESAVVDDSPPSSLSCPLMASTRLEHLSLSEQWNGPAIPIFVGSRSSSHCNENDKRGRQRRQLAFLANVTFVG